MLHSIVFRVVVAISFHIVFTLLYGTPHSGHADNKRERWSEFTQGHSFVLAHHVFSVGYRVVGPVTARLQIIVSVCANVLILT